MNPTQSVAGVSIRLLVLPDGLFGSEERDEPQPAGTGFAPDESEDGELACTSAIQFCFRVGRRTAIGNARTSIEPDEEQHYIHAVEMVQRYVKGRRSFGGEELHRHSRVPRCGDGVYRPVAMVAKLNERRAEKDAHRRLLPVLLCQSDRTVSQKCWADLAPFTTYRRESAKSGSRLLPFDSTMFELTNEPPLL
jgi:hypothetical protein